MACFLVPTTVGGATTLLRKKFPEEMHIDWLNMMIWGGAVGLAVEHVAHGEIMPWPPFLTAMATPADTAAMFREMASVGIPMTVGLILAWGVMVLAYEKIIVPKRIPLLNGLA